MAAADRRDVMRHYSFLRASCVAKTAYASGESQRIRRCSWGEFHTAQEDLDRVYVKSPKPRFGLSRPNADVVPPEAVKLALERTHHAATTLGAVKLRSVTRTKPSDAIEKTDRLSSGITASGSCLRSPCGPSDAIEKTDRLSSGITASGSCLRSPCGSKRAVIHTAVVYTNILVSPFQLICATLDVDVTMWRQVEICGYSREVAIALLPKLKTTELRLELGRRGKKDDLKKNLFDNEAETVSNFEENMWGYAQPPRRVRETKTSRSGTDKNATWQSYKQQGDPNGPVFRTDCCN
ncbi:hypothetical protein Bbelb_099440 [Branchiostoma belcheri]|nr:hypothetical protein Bbelb_099440 [Branchiostoma belcheri]